MHLGNVHEARDARDRAVTRYAPDRPDLAAVAYRAVFVAGETKGLGIAGGECVPGQQDTSGRYAP